MTIDDLREVHRARPFQPFTLQLADGKEVDVPHPEFLAFTRSGRTIIVATADTVFKVIDLRLVVSIEVGKTRRTNGRRRRGRR